MATILSILLIIIVFYGWFGAVIFYNSEQGVRDFSNLVEGCWTMWICVTTANYPDVMMPSYNNNRLSGIFFISYMLITFFLIMNLVLASVVNAYDETIETRKKLRKEVALESLTEAFHLMDPRNTGRVTRDHIMALFVVLNEDFPEIRELSEEETKLLFGFLDRDGSSLITLEEFQDFGSVLLLEFTKESGTDIQVLVVTPHCVSLMMLIPLQIMPRLYRSDCQTSIILNGTRSCALLCAQWPLNTRSISS